MSACKELTLGVGVEPWVIRISGNLCKSGLPENRF